MTDNERDSLHPQVTGEDPDDEDETFSNNYALAIAFGLPFGTVLGLLVFDNIGLGVALGIAFSPVIALLMGKMNTD